jgi:hypothetical protein
LKSFYPDTIAARIGATIIVSLTVMVAISSFLIYLEGASNGDFAEWLAQGRIVNAVQLLDACPKGERATIAAALNTPTIGVLLRDTPAIAKGDEIGLQTHKLGELLTTVARDALDRRSLGATRGGGPLCA